MSGAHDSGNDGNRIIGVGEIRSSPAVETAVIDGATFTNRAVQFVEIDGMAMVEGDIVLGSAEEVREQTRERVEHGPPEAAAVITGDRFRWIGGVVPFEIDGNLPNQQRVTDAIAHWERHTRLRFVARTAANAAGFPDFIRFVPGNGCSSAVGRRGGRQSITLGASCTTGNCVHEIGHAVGLWHEQSREDRDRFITIAFANIQPGFEHNFDQQITDGDDVGPYDYGSIMHYPRDAFSVNGQDTIVPTTPGVAIGQRTGLSDGDVAAIRAMYGPAPDSGPVVSSESNRLDAFVVGTDSAVFHKWWNGTKWDPSNTGYERLGGIAMSRPEVVTWGFDRLDAFVIGTDSALHHKWWNGSSWGPSAEGWESLGGICTSRPEIASWAPNRLDVFVIGTDSALWHKWWDGSRWGPSNTGFESLGGICTSPPTALAWGPHRLDVFVIGTDSALYHKWWDGNQWGPSTTGWESLGGICMGQPTVVSWARDRLDVFVIGTDSALYHKWWDGNQWGPSTTGFEKLGGISTSPPTAVSWARNRLDVFLTGTDSALYHKCWDGTRWQPSVDGFHSLGGIVTRFTT